MVCLYKINSNVEASCNNRTRRVIDVFARFFFFLFLLQAPWLVLFYKPSRKYFFLKLKSNCIALYSNNRRSFIKQRGSIGCIELFAQFIFLFEFIARKKRYKVVGPVPTFYFKTMNWFFFFSCCLHVFFSIHY